MTLPGFLIIGAMKAGTTSLFRDLDTQPTIFFPDDKEPNSLCSDEVLSQPGQERYESLFQAARGDQVCGEASTAYSKLPTYSGVPARAKRLLGSELRIVYLVRHPIARALSHFHHEQAYNPAAADADTALIDDPTYVQYSSYSMQIRPWLDEFGQDKVRLLVFENYVQQRRETIRSLCEFLNVKACPELVNPDRAYNVGAGKPLGKGPLKHVYTSSMYRKLVRPLLPRGARDTLRAILLPSASKERALISSATRADLVERLTSEVDELRRLFPAAHINWDLEADDGSQDARSAAAS